jgi:hypothetical protein
MGAGRLAISAALELFVVCSAAAAASTNASSASFRTDNEAAAFQASQHSRRLQKSPLAEDKYTARVRRRPHQSQLPCQMHVHHIALFPCLADTRLCDCAIEKSGLWRPPFEHDSVAAHQAKHLPSAKLANCQSARFGDVCGPAGLLTHPVWPHALQARASAARCIQEAATYEHQCKARAQIDTCEQVTRDRSCARGCVTVA